MDVRWNEVMPLLSRAWNRQRILIVVAVLVYAIFWAIGQPGPIGINLIYSLCLGNVTFSLLEAFEFLYRGERRFHWIRYLALLLAIAPLAVFLASSIAFWADTRPLGGHFQIFPPSPLFWRYQRTSWKFPFLVTLVVPIFVELFLRAKSRLECRNRELQRSVELEIAKRELQEQELERAREIQQQLLPKTIPQLRGFEIAASWEPARMVGGDYFDLIQLSDKKLAICIADVVGKSISAALLMANVQATVRAFATEAAAPSWLCNRVNSVLCSNIASGKFVTFFYGVLDAEHHTFQYTNAGHLPPLLVTGASAARRLENGGALLGVFPDWKYEDSHIQLAPGDRLMLFTDGVTEAAAANGEEFGEERLLAAAKAFAALPSSELNQAVLNRVKHFCNSQLEDDATLVNVSVLAAPARCEAEVINVVSASGCR
ncbi:MAG TPA: PP2C family protein-serine/threonine phosphatase [Terriglobales bacterium]|nr:PP2C family protein-serine/threonine phosphatase [Terriglobales bacterium]